MASRFRPKRSEESQHACILPNSFSLAFTYRVDMGLNGEIEEALLKHLDELAGLNDSLLAQRLLIEPALVSE